MKKNFIGIIANDSPQLTIGLLGILKSGNTFVPISPTIPNDRIEFIIRDCGIAVLLTDRDNYEKSRQVAESCVALKHLICIDDEVENGCLAETTKERDCGVDEYCYLIYTSGSTGQPKGVPITHRNLIPLFTWFRDYFRLGSHTRVMQNLSYTFDFGVFELLTTVLYGGRLYVLDKSEIGEFGFYGQFICRHMIDTVHSTPVFFSNVVMSAGSLPSLGLVHLGGERLSGKMVRDIAGVVSPDCLIHNGYGPTEATINCSIFTLRAGALANLDDSAGIPIGGPTAWNSLYVLDKNYYFQPIGVAGELGVAGAGLANGYLNRPELSAQRFISIQQKDFEFNKSAESIAIYTTGDLTRWLPEGNIEFLGRIDFQVKVRGFRIELGEIEAKLLTFSSIRDAVVIAKEHDSGGHYLCAYFVTDSNSSDHLPAVSDLRAHLSTDLPDYMIPAYFVHLNQFPLTTTGKVDRKKLPEPDPGLISTGTDYMPPVTAIEHGLVRIWQGLLKIERIGILDDFFELGGDSILANRCIARIREELSAEVPLRKFFEQPYIKSIAREIESNERKNSAIPVGDRNGLIPLSFAQERLWFLQELDASNVAYFVPRVIRITGELKKELFERTFTEIIRRHEILRTRFVMMEGQPVQQIMPPYRFEIPLLDWTSETPIRQEQNVNAFLEAESNKAFDFNSGVLLRVTLLKLKEKEHLFVLTEHHLVHDGWTQGVLLREIIDIFTAFSQDRPSPLGDLPIQYADFALWQRSFLQGDVLNNHLDYWRVKLAGAPPVLELPGDKTRPPVISGKGDLNVFRISPEITSRLKEFCKKHNITLFMAMLAVFKLFLYRYTGVEDLCVGTGIANRSHKEMEGLLGMVINTLPLRTVLDAQLPGLDLVKQVKMTCLEAYQHEDTPFGKIVEALQPERSLKYMPLFQVMFSFMDTPTEDLHLPGVQLELLDFHNRSSKFDINVVVVPPPEPGRNDSLAQPREDILVEWEYSTDIFEPDSIERMVGYYNRLLVNLLDNPGKSLSSLSMLSEDQLRQLVLDFNSNQTDYPAEQTIDSIFTRIAEQFPDSVALNGLSVRTPLSSLQLTYKQLNSDSHCWANGLVAQGAQPGSVIGIKLDRSVEMLTGILAILKTGGAYMPIDPGYPEDRVNYMLCDSGTPIVITPDTLSSLETGTGTTGPITESLHCEKGFSPAYVIYTSGTTGRPKGVLVENRNVLRLVINSDFVPMSTDTRILQTGAPVFDATTFEYWGPLLKGGQLVLVNNDCIPDAHQLGLALKQFNINTLWLSSPLFNQLVQVNDTIFEGLSYLLVGGDVLTPASINLAASRNPGLTIINGYGPTENTTFSTTFRISRKYNENIPIGKPITNSTAYIVDKYRNLQPVGVVGELWVGGEGVARGYLNRPELTSEKFDTVAFQCCGTFTTDLTVASTHVDRIYKTGDLARWLTDGCIEFMGRSDSQVKIRGFRIELGEIESSLLKQEGVREAVVIARKDTSGEKVLCAYIGSDSQLTASQVKKGLGDELPDYMIPSFVIILDSLPLNPNGKVDRRALPEPGMEQAASIYSPPRNPIEKQLLTIWIEILNRDSIPGNTTEEPESSVIGIDHNFFQLGGHSLKATLMLARIHRVLNVRVPLTEIFLHPTIRELAKFIENTAESPYIRIEAVEEKEYYPLSSAQKRLYILQQMGEQDSNTAYNIPYVAELIGQLDVEHLSGVFNRLVSRHDSFRTSFHVVNEEPVQRIHREVKFEIERHHVSVDGENPSPDSFVYPFDLSLAPLLQVGLIVLEPQRHLLLLDMHHIISDGISTEILSREFMSLYEGKELPRLSIRYKDFSQWQNRAPGRSIIQKQGAFWLHEFNSDIPVLDLPTDYPRPLIQQFEGESIYFQIEDDLFKKLNDLALTHGATVFMVLLSIYYIFLSRLSGQEDLVVGTPVGGRRLAGLDSIVGMFVNTLALRDFPRGELTFVQFLSQVKNRTLKAFANQDYPYEELVDHVVVERDPGRNPLFDTMFALLNLDIGGIHTTNLQFKPYDYKDNKSKFDFMLTAIEEGTGLSFRFQYCTRLFKRETITRFTEYFKTIFSSAIHNPNQLLGEFQIIPASEKQQILFRFNETRNNFSGSHLIHRIFEAQVEKTPDATAIIENNRDKSNQPVNREFLSYNEFNNRVNQLVSILTIDGIGPDSIVAIMTQRSLKMVMGIFAILKAGGAYLPIDPGFPTDRIDYIIKDSNASVLLIDKNDNPGGYYPVPVIDLSVAFTTGNGEVQNKTALPGDWNKQQLAYIIYTSGSTGKPKGVLVQHESAVNTLWALQSKYPLGSDDAYLFKTAYIFDVSVSELFGWFMGGGRLVILEPGGEKDPFAILDTVQAESITHINFVPSMFNVFTGILDTEYRSKLASLHYIFLAGEALWPGLINTFKSFNPGIILENLYGPTEAAVYATWFSLSQWDGSGDIPIGLPITNVSIYIFNCYGDVQPVGIPGELMIGGTGLARGYLNKPEMTIDRFPVFNKRHLEYGVPAAYDRLYRSGDLARWLADGNIEFLGRMDNQVKVRGFRIELGEIEHCLLRHPSIKEATVIVHTKESSENLLCAYVTVDHQFFGTEGDGESLSHVLKEHLSLHLPGYMVPDYFEFLDTIPLTPSGKIDRKSLPLPVWAVDTTLEKPVNKREEIVASIWGTVLGLEAGQISMTANFFKLGGHSLKAAILISQIRKQLGIIIPLSEIFKYPTIRTLSGFIAQRGVAGGDGLPEIKAVEEKEYYPLSSAQQRLYLLDQLTPGSITYNMPQLLATRDDFDFNRLEFSFNQLIRRHESLRTSFHMVHEEPVQRIHKEVKFEIGLHHVNLVGDVPEADSFIHPFDLGQAPLLRVDILKSSDNQQYVMVDLHHIVTDGTSQEILTRELVLLYRGESLASMELQYKDYACWQVSASRQESINQQGKWWLSRFRDDIPVLDIPTDYSRPPVQHFEGNRWEFVIPVDKTNALTQLAEQESATLFMVLMALYSIFLGKISGQEDIVVGSPVAGRRHTGITPLVGMFVNTLALRTKPLSILTARDFIAQVKELILQALENQDYPFEDLVEQLALPRDTGRNPLFDTVFILQNVQVLPSTGNNTQHLFKPVELHTGVAKFDLTFSATQSNGFINCVIEYSTHLFMLDTIKRYAGFFKTVIDAVLSKPDIPIADIAVISVPEKKQILLDFNRPIRPYGEKPQDEMYFDLFIRQAVTSPDALALAGKSVFNEPAEASGGHISLTYNELYKASLSRAEQLFAMGVLPGTIAALKMERSIDLVIVMLAVLRLGAVYLPVDPGYPEDRINYMVQDSGTNTVITADTLSAFTNDSNIPQSTAVTVAPKDGGSAAYIIYTSGTTGRPRGTLVSHRSLINLCTWHNTYFQVNERDHMTQYANIGFDASVWEIFPPLVAGAALYMIREDLRIDVDALNRYFIKHTITMSFLPTPVCHQFMKLENSSLRMVLTGGDKLQSFEKRNYLLYNNYGPTENTVVTTCCPVEEFNDNIPIGKPIDNVNVYILGREYSILQPVGVTGELCIAGESLAMGYLNLPLLTAETFCTLDGMFFDPVGYNNGTQSVRFYKTGDLARWLPDGNIQFLGRSDFQVKIRGFRIELAEIENRIMSHPQVQEAVVITREKDSQEKFLCAYIIPHDAYGEFDSPSNCLADVLKEHLSQSLPRYMIPSYFVMVSEIPLTQNGKVDRKALPMPEPGNSDNEFTAPQSRMEKQMADIWSEVLEISPDSIGIDQNFFELGGHSLKVNLLTSRIQKRLNINMPVVEVFKHPTIREQVQYITQAEQNLYKAIPAIEQREYYPVSSAQKRMYILNLLKGHNTSDNTPEVILVEGLLDEVRFDNTIRQLIDRHEPLRTSFHLIDELPVQRVHDRVEFVVERIEVPEEMTLEEIHEGVCKTFVRPFSLDTPPLCRVALVRINKEKHLILYDIHHIIRDGSSSVIFIKEFIRFYNEVPLPELRIQYKDFSTWQNDLLKSEAIKKQEAYWLEEFSGELPVLELSTDFPRPSVQSFEGDCIYFRLDKDVSQYVRQIALAHGATLFMVLMAVYTILLSKYSNQEDIVVGSPIAGRPHPDLENLIGMFVNTLALRHFPSGEKTFSQFLEEVKESALKAFDNQDYQFEALVNRLGIPPDPARQSLFDTMLAVQNMDEVLIDADSKQIKGLDFKRTQFTDRITQFDIMFHAAERFPVIEFRMLYCTRLFKEETIRLLIENFRTIIDVVTTNEDILIKDIKITHGLFEEKIHVPDTQFGF